VVQKLEQFAPTSLAGSWDNVGLLIEPMNKKPISRIFMTNDLTEPVMEEALKTESDMIISYHPPLFRPMKRFTSKSWKERIAVTCMENRIALYSPHTSWDAVQGGINDWLLIPFGSGSRYPCEDLDVPGSVCYSVEGLDQSRQTLPANRTALLKQYTSYSEEERKAVKITKHEPHPLVGMGAGRVLHLDNPVKLYEAVNLIKNHLKLKHVRLAVANQVKTLDAKVERVGVCAGSGGSVLANVSADLVLTGEMSHHEVLDFVHRGVSVILTDHSNTERGFHAYFRDKLVSMLDKKVEVVLSTVDADPLCVV